MLKACANRPSCSITGSFSIYFMSIINDILLTDRTAELFCPTWMLMRNASLCIVLTDNELSHGSWMGRSRGLNESTPSPWKRHGGLIAINIRNRHIYTNIKSVDTSITKQNNNITWVDLFGSFGDHRAPLCSHLVPQLSHISTSYVIIISLHFNLSTGSHWKLCPECM
jgi:hypothetical protein